MKRKVGRPRKERNYASTVEEVREQAKRKEQKRRDKIRVGMLKYREDERVLYRACMSTQEMRQLAQQEELIWQLYRLLNDEK